MNTRKAKSLQKFNQLFTLSYLSSENK